MAPLLDGPPIVSECVAVDVTDPFLVGSIDGKLTVDVLRLVISVLEWNTQTRVVGWIWVRCIFFKYLGRSFYAKASCLYLITSKC